MLHTFLLVALMSLAQVSRPSGPAVPITDLADAVERGLVKAVVLGTGGSSGDVIEVKATRVVNTPLRLRLPRGTMLRSLAEAVPDMVVARVKGERAGTDEYYPSEIIELSDGKERVYVVEAYCLGFGKRSPGVTDRFLISTPNHLALAVIDSLPEAQRSLGAVQAALWLSAGVPTADIRRRFTISNSDMAAAERAVAAAGPSVRPIPITDLADAVERGLVTVVVSGTGGSSGDVIQLKVTRMASTPLRLQLRRGTVLKSVGGAVQDMLVAKIKGERTADGGYYPSELIDLQDDKQRIYVVEAYCLDFEKENPGVTNRFLISTVNGSALTVIDSLPEAQRSLGAIQAALWLSVGVSKEEIGRRFTVSSSDMVAAERAVVTARGR